MGSKDEELKELNDIVQEQQSKILQIEQSTDVGRQRDKSKLSIKAPMPNTYGGSVSERNSVSLRSFFFRLQKAGEFSNISDEELTSLALCHLSGRAATWAMRNEREGNKPQDVEELRRAMFKEFVPSMEKQ